MNRLNEVAGLEAERLRPGMSAAFGDLVRIYREAIPSSERKHDDVLREMLARDDYEFRIARLGNGAVGFTIVKAFRNCDATLLEYMAVDRGHRGIGIGSELFRQASGAESTIARYLLIEAEDEEEVAVLPEAGERLRRKAFYRANGCREVAGLSYLMPTVSAEPPPRMNLLAYRHSLPATIEKAELRRWLQSIYVEVYGQSASDRRIEQMLATIPGHVGLR